MPVTVYGPVTPISPFVRVTGVLPTAEVTILDNGTSIGHATAVNPGELLVPLSTQPQVGHSITAVQKTADGTSAPSAQGVPVVDVPDPLPVPVILSALNTCMSDIWADGVVPGARVVTLIGGQPFGSSVASQSPAWLGIDPTRQIAPGSRAEIHQETHIGTTTRASESVQSPNIPAFQPLSVHLVQFKARISGGAKRAADPCSIPSSLAGRGPSEETFHANDCAFQVMATTESS